MGDDAVLSPGLNEIVRRPKAAEFSDGTKISMADEEKDGENIVVQIGYHEEEANHYVGNGYWWRTSTFLGKGTFGGIYPFKSTDIFMVEGTRFVQDLGDVMINQLTDLFSGKKTVH